MKKIVFGIMMLSILCSAVQAELKDTTEMNFLQIGRYSLGIDKKFELLGTRESELKKDIFGETKASRIRSKEYLFADLSDGIDNISKGLIVYDNQLKDLQQFWAKEISYKNTKVPGKVDSGYVKVGRINMAYMILNAKPSIDPNIKRIITAKSSKMGKNLQELDQVSMVYFAKLIGRSRNVVIVYIDGKENPELAFNESLRYLTLDK